MDKARARLTYSLVAIVGFLTVCPVVMLALGSVSEGLTAFGRFTLDKYLGAYTDPAFFRVMFNTAVFVLGSSVLATVLAVFLAYLNTRTDIPFNPNVKDGRCTQGLAINKSNWANTLDTPPYEGYAVTCGITFTFGGLRVNTDCEVLNTDYQPIRGLYAAGELVGGVFYFNYPGGSGLCSGSVFGKIAGTSAGRAAN